MLVGIAALAGGLAGGKIGADSVNETVAWAHALHRADVQELGSGRQLPPIDEPASVSRKPRNGFIVWSLGTFIGGVFGFLAVLLFVQLVAEGSPEVTGFERLLGGVFFGLFGAAVGGLAGAFLGYLLYLMEVRARVAAFKGELRRAVWEQREQLRNDLREGRIEPTHAIAELERAMAG